MYTAKANTRKRRATQPELTKSGNLHLDLDLSNYINGIMSALQQIREKTHKDGLKKNEETISRKVLCSLASKIGLLASRLAGSSRAVLTSPPRHNSRSSSGIPP